MLDARPSWRQKRSASLAHGTAPATYIYIYIYIYMERERER